MGVSGDLRVHMERQDNVSGIARGSERMILGHDRDGVFHDMGGWVD